MEKEFNKNDFNSSVCYLCFLGVLGLFQNEAVLASQ